MGYRAAPQLTKEQFEQLYDTRIQLEPYVASKAASSISEEALDRLAELLDGLMSVSSKDPNLTVRSAQVDLEFHRTIATESGNLVIARILNSLQVQVQFALLRRRVDPIDVRPVSAEHRRILAALRKRDIRAAAARMREHLFASRARYWP